ncbi:MAG: hypothetical protein WCP39_07655 [Chlamydiota bacterium]
MNQKQIKKKIIDLATKDSNFRDNLKKVTKTERLTDHELEKIAGGMAELTEALAATGRFERQ